LREQGFLLTKCESLLKRLCTQPNGFKYL